MERNHVLGKFGFGKWVLLRHLLKVHFRKLTKFGFKFGCRLRLQLPLKKLTRLRARLDGAYCASEFWGSCFLFFFFFFFFSQHKWTVIALFMHMDSLCRRESALFISPTTTLFRKKILKMGYTTLLTHLKIILIQSFQFSFFSKIICIQMDPSYFENLTIDYMFFIFLTHTSNFVTIGYYLLHDA